MTIRSKMLIGLLAFDSIFTYIFWTYGLAEEQNPLMLWALQQGWMYWAIKIIQIGFGFGLAYLFYNHKIARVATNLLVIIFAITWIQFFIGCLI